MSQLQHSRWRGHGRLSHEHQHAQPMEEVAHTPAQTWRSDASPVLRICHAACLKTCGLSYTKLTHAEADADSSVSDASQEVKER